eukprot:g4297.t1
MERARPGCGRSLTSLGGCRVGSEVFGIAAKLALPWIMPATCAATLCLSCDVRAGLPALGPVATVATTPAAGAILFRALLMTLLVAGTVVMSIEIYADLTSALALLDDPAVRASAMFVASSSSTYRRDRLDVFDAVLRGGTGAAPILPPDALHRLRRVYEVCKRVALSALMGAGHDLLRYAQKSDLFMLRLLRYAGDSDGLDLEHHTDPSLYTLHIPLGDNYDSFMEHSSFFPGDQAELVTAGAIRAAAHGAAGRRKRAAVVLFLQADTDAVLAGDAGSGETGLSSLSAFWSSVGGVPSPAPMVNISSPHAMPGLDLLSIRVYWGLLRRLNEGDDGEASPTRLPSVVGAEGKSWWTRQIEIYRAWLAAMQAASTSGGACYADVPPPPRIIRWMWVAHMLQPKLYAQDCQDIFGEVLPHDNAQPVAEMPSADFRAWWTRFAGADYPAFGAQLRRPSLRVDWWKGLDSSSVLYKDMVEKFPSLVFSDADGVDALAQYKRLVVAVDTAHANGRSLQAGPGTMVDFVWHAHQCSPLAYGEFNRERERALGVPFFDHEPCGELNPPDPQWLVNTREAWAEMFPGHACIECPQGMFQDHKGKEECKYLATSGYFAMRGIKTSALHCRACAADSFQIDEGKTFCVAHRNCVAGESVTKPPSVTSNRECMVCKSNGADPSFSNSTNAPQCTNCAEHPCDDHTPRKSCGGASEGYCGACNPGTRLHNRVCETCEAGRYAESENAAVCKDCPGGKYQELVKATYCVTCSIGMRGDDGRSKANEGVQCK